MRSFSNMLLLINIMGIPCFAGVVQDIYLSNVQDVSRVLITHLRDAEEGHVTLLDTEDRKEIKRIVESIELKDPPKEYDEEGNEIITGPCFCVAEYFIAFTNAKGKVTEYPIHSHFEVTIPEDHGLGYATDVELSKKSVRRLKKIFNNAKSK